MFKKVLISLLCLTLLLTATSLTAFAAEGDEVLVTMGLYVGDWSADKTVEVTARNTEYTITVEKEKDYEWLMLKAATDNNLTTLPVGTVVRTTKLAIDGKTYELNDPSIVDYVVGSDQKIEIPYYLIHTNTDHIVGNPKKGAKFEVTFIIDPVDEPDEPEPEPDPEVPDLTPIKVELSNASSTAADLRIDLGADNYLDAGETFVLIMSGSTDEDLRAYIANNAGSNHDRSNIPNPIVTFDETEGGKFTDVVVEFTGNADGDKVAGTDAHYLWIKDCDRGGNATVTIDAIYIFRCTKADFETWHAAHPEWSTENPVIEPDEPDEPDNPDEPDEPDEPDKKNPLYDYSILIDMGEQYHAFKVGPVIITLPHEYVDGVCSVCGRHSSAQHVEEEEETIVEPAE